MSLTDAFDNQEEVQKKLKDLYTKRDDILKQISEVSAANDLSNYLIFKRLNLIHTIIVDIFHSRLPSNFTDYPEVIFFRIQKKRFADASLVVEYQHVFTYNRHRIVYNHLYFNGKVALPKSWFDCDDAQLKSLVERVLLDPSCTLNLDYESFIQSCSNCLMS